MAGPSTEYLAEQLDRVREEVQAARREGVDGWKQWNNTFASEIREVRERVGEEMVQLRREVGAGVEVLKVDQALTRENMARLETKTEATIARIDRNHETIRQVVFWSLGLLITLTTVGAGMFWRASQAVHRLDDQGRRLETVEKDTKEGQAKLRESIEKTSESQARALDRAIDGQARVFERINASIDKTNDNQAKATEKFNASQDKLRESIDKTNDNQAKATEKFNASQDKLRESIDQLRKTLDERLPARPPAPR